MKKSILFIVMAVAAMAMGVCSTKESSTRDYDYEAYCDSIWYNDPDYYTDILMESEEYQSYVELNGQWW